MYTILHVSSRKLMFHVELWPQAIQWCCILYIFLMIIFFWRPFIILFLEYTVNNENKQTVFVRSAYILKQESLPPSYKSFLNKHGGKDTVILKGVKEIATGMRFTNLGAIEKFYKANGMDIKLDPSMKVPCSVCILWLLYIFFLYQVIAVSIHYTCICNFMHLKK